MKTFLPFWNHFAIAILISFIPLSWKCIREYLVYDHSTRAKFEWWRHVIGVGLTGGFILEHRGMQLYQSLREQRTDFPTVKKLLWNVQFRWLIETTEHTPPAHVEAYLATDHHTEMCVTPLWLWLYILIVDMGLWVWDYCARESTCCKVVAVLQETV